MSKIKYFSENQDVQGKTILLRLDLNVPLNKKKIEDKSRIFSSLPFLKDLIKKKAKIIIISHLGRPKGIKDNELSLTPIYKFLKEQLQTNVYFFMGDINEETKSKFSYLKEGEVILLENIRFFKEESENEDNFAKKLASLGDIYVNDAFSCCHRAQASIHKITKYIKESYAGPLLKTEVRAISSIIQNKKEPVTCIIGGSKISTKINIITNLIKNVNNIVIVGAMANNFLTFKGFKVGKSIYENNCGTLVKEILDISKKFNCKITCPIDAVVSENIEGEGKNKDIKEINDNDMILDIGPKTISLIRKIINESNTILWNGPAGYFENPNFQDGTKKILEAISIKTKKDKIFSVAGGGETVAAINKFGKSNCFTFISTAGGAFLEYLEGKTLPGIRALNQNV